MAVKIYNTQTRTKENFEPINAPDVLWYNCGPTVYDYFHIGNARNFVVVDTIRRYLEYRGYNVKFVQNFTDIDDKIINKAKKEKTTSRSVSRKFTDIYFQQAEKLNIRRADFHPKATETIPAIIEIISELIQKGHAYELAGDVYFRVKSFAGYGKLSGKKIDELEEGARVEVDSRKENPLDFALWKNAKPEEPSWESPWGKGRPGWHIECSAMSRKYLGEQIDIHSGGVDLVFPHHENEVAQSECTTGKQYVKYWLHNGFLNINHEKMSKSLNNFFTVNQILEKFDPVTVRYFLISAHYRHPLDFCDENLNDAKNAIQRIKNAIETADKLLDSVEHISAPDQQIISRDVEIRNKFIESMDDDFNTAQAIGSIFEFVSELNETIAKINKTSDDKEKAMLYTKLSIHLSSVKEILALLGLEGMTRQDMPGVSAGDSAADSDLTEKVFQILIDLRNESRKEKNFQIADKIRNRLNDISVVLEDHPQGTIWKKK